MMNKMVNKLDDDSSSNRESETATLSEAPKIGLGLPSETAYVKPKEENHASSSWNHLQSYFVGMGFSPSIVEKVIEENGADDADSILETLFTYTALKKSDCESPHSPDGLVGLETEKSSSLDFTLSSSQEDEETDGCDEVNSDKRKRLLVMNFSAEEVDFAINRLGEDASVTDLVDDILAAQTTGSPGRKNRDDPKVITNETLFGTMNKTLRLLEMGFSEDEVSEVIENFGSDVPIMELADSIFANQIARRSALGDKDDPPKPDCAWNLNTSRSIGCASQEFKDPGFFGSQVGDTKKSSTSTIDRGDVKAMEKGKRVKDEPLDDKFEKRVKHGTSDGNFSSIRTPKHEAGDIEPKPDSRSDHYEWLETKPTISENFNPTIPKSSRNHHRLGDNQPYFFYANVLEISKEAWGKISQFLNNSRPEFSNTQAFSAFIRKEGYIHNLPTENRSQILSRPPVTIEEALPHTKKWWPSWDTRKRLSCITSESSGTGQICKRLERILLDSHGVFSKEQESDILRQCENSNLIWVGQYKLRPIEAAEVERILGYPVGHTQIGMCTETERLRLLNYSYQTDTLGYHFSTLKQLFPNGLTLLSIFNGTGGAEVALHRLGIHLKVVVCVEPSKTNRVIFRKWWNSSGQTGELVIIEDVQALRVKMLDNFIRQYDGFDLVIGGNPLGNSNGEHPVGVNYPMFFEFTRVLQRLRQRMRINR